MGTEATGSIPDWVPREASVGLRGKVDYPDTETSKALPEVGGQVDRPSCPLSGKATVHAGENDVFTS